MVEYPRVLVNLEKIRDNARILKDKCIKKNISIMGVTKSFCAELNIARAMVAEGVQFLADSRLTNLEKLGAIDIPKVLIRIPMKSNAKKVVEVADISLNSELKTIHVLNNEAEKQGKIHGIILMVELGDLREGILPKNFQKAAKETIDLPHLKLMGIGVNLTCYGGVIPDNTNLGELSDLATQIENKFGVSLEIISGGNSSSLYLLNEKNFPEKINNLRLGEAIILGRETTYGKSIRGTHGDAFILEAEIIEIKEKPSVPIGTIGLDAFGNKPQFQDMGIRKRAILAVGRQDIEHDGIIPLDPRIKVLGASSDHLLLDISDSERDYKLGDIISFQLKYGSLLKVMTSNYVKKDFLGVVD